jgi:hypothetical protein
MEHKQWSNDALPGKELYINSETQLLKEERKTTTHLYLLNAQVGLLVLGSNSTSTCVVPRNENTQKRHFLQDCSSSKLPSSGDGSCACTSEINSKTGTDIFTEEPI